MDADTIQVTGKKRSERNPARAKALVRQMQEGCRKAGLFKGMTKDEILAAMRRTREEVWEETKDAAGSRR